MRLIGRFGASARRQAGLALLAALGLSFLASATASSAAVAADSLPGSATAFAEPATATGGTAIMFQVTCASLDDSTATLFATVLGLPAQVPMNKEVSEGGVFSVTVTLPRDIEPGTYHPDIDCSDGSSATATLRVTPLPAGGGAQTGDGTTSTQTDSGLTFVGLALIAVGAVTGGIAMRRRTSVRRS